MLSFGVRSSSGAVPSTGDRFGSLPDLHIACRTGHRTMATVTLVTTDLNPSAVAVTL